MPSCKSDKISLTNWWESLYFKVTHKMENGNVHSQKSPVINIFFKIIKQSNCSELSKDATQISSCFTQYCLFPVSTLRHHEWWKGRGACVSTITPQHHYASTHRLTSTHFGGHWHNCVHLHIRIVQIPVYPSLHMALYPLIYPNPFLVFSIAYGAALAKSPPANVAEW